MATRIRYLDNEIPVALGEFSIGRQGNCSLCLEDALVSRKHALIRVDHAGSTIEDLQSRNGVTVNGAKIEFVTPLHDGDLIVIGGHELTFLSDQGTRKLSGGRITLIDPAKGPPSKTSNEHSAVKITKSITRDSEPNWDRVEETTAHNPIVTLAEKAFALGRVEDAEKVLQRMLSENLQQAKTQKLEAIRFFESTNYALRLAALAKKPAWIDYVFELHGAMDRVLSGETQDRLHEIVRAIRYASSPAFRTYIEKVRKLAPQMSPGDKFLVQRLSGLESYLGS